ncbi:DUF1697 domain-containing protein [Methanoregula sp.]|jgi:uncharacterized protein (DUF1697 family)|uniref:DUF1697 domain-containing protein n=1 Tax=Methanoregula sp. TaxID=2052170 RepID=UPI003C273A53
MVQFITLLRGINVGGHNKVRMDDLVTLFESLGFTHVRTYLQSGNIVFNSSVKEISTLSAIIERGIFQQFDFRVTVIIRTSEEFNNIILENPFVKEGYDSDTLHVTFLSDRQKIISENKISGEDTQDKYVVKGREIFLFCPRGYGRTKFTTTFFERKQGVTATTRNWNTIQALSGMAGEL